jgi:hypothetical protein
MSENGQIVMGVLLLASMYVQICEDKQANASLRLCKDGRPIQSFRHMVPPVPAPSARANMPWHTQST